MVPAQRGILLPAPRLAVYLTFDLAARVDARDTLARLGDQVDGEQVVAGIGLSVVQALGRQIEGLRVLADVRRLRPQPGRLRDAAAAHGRRRGRYY